MVKAFTENLENLTKLRDSMTLPDTTLQNLAQNYLFDTSFIHTVLAENAESQDPMFALNEKVPRGGTTEKKSLKLVENQEIKLNCRNFIFKIQQIMEMPMHATEILALLTQIHNMFLKSEDPEYVKIGTEYAGFHALGGTTLRDTLDHFHILLRPFKDLLDDLRQWQTRIVKNNPLYEILGTPNQYLTKASVYAVVNKFKNKSTGKGNNKNTRGGYRGRFRGRGRGFRGRGRGGGFRQNPDETEPQAKTPKKEH